MGPWNQSTKKCIKEIKYWSLHNNSQEKQDIKPMVGKTIQGRTYSGIKFKICSTILLYSKEGQISMIDTRLQEVKPGYNKRQDSHCF